MITFNLDIESWDAEYQGHVVFVRPDRLFKLEGNGPKDSRAKVISDSELGLKFEMRILNYPGNHVHVVSKIK